METLGTARLTAEIPAERAVTTIVPREEIAGALHAPDRSPELYLDVTRGEERGTIGISWSPDELERLLEGTGDDIVLTFDRHELETVFDDVEAHGLREKALVFAVAAAGALASGATIANAAPILDHGSADVPVAMVQTLAHESLATEAGSPSNVHTPGLQVGDSRASVVAPSVHVSASVADEGVASNVHTPGLQTGDVASIAGTRRPGTTRPA